MNEKQIRRTFELMKSEGDVIEIRVITNGKRNYSGYFTNVDSLIKSIQPFDNYNIYFVLNKINDACFSREQSNVILENPKVTTSDNDIMLREWLLIDIDTKRSTGVSATDKEKLNSKKTANNVYSFLRDFGFNEPICTDSGNGYHLLYKINMENNDESKILLQRVLQLLDLYFSSDGAEIDKSVFNASRITKLYGTTARKGKNTDDRPHRESYIIRSPETIKATPIELLKKVADLIPVEEKPNYSNNYGKETFSLDDFIHKHNIQVKSIDRYNGGIKYNLEHCLFDESHKGKDACLFQMANGAIGYKCLHNSCSSYKWQDVRKLYEPSAYDVKYDYRNQRDVVKYVPIAPQSETQKNGKKFLSLKEIENVDRSKIVSIPSGLHKIDRKIIGFNKGEISMWSGKNGSAKSTILNQVCVNAVQNGFNVLIFSGELTPQRVKTWTQLQCAGRLYTKPTDYENLYFVPNNIGEMIDNWLNDKFIIYNNRYGTEYKQLIEDIRDYVMKNNIDMVVLDNIMTIDFELVSGDKYDKQKNAILGIHRLAEELNIHIHIVAHPRKSLLFLRKDDISGSSDLTNVVENVFICHRLNKDFYKVAKDFFDQAIIDGFDEQTNAIEICKNRDLGVMDEIFGFYYEVESKRILNYKYENKIYKWRDLYEGHFIKEKYEKEEPEQSPMQLKPNYQFESNTAEDEDKYDENGNWIPPF